MNTTLVPSYIDKVEADVLLSLYEGWQLSGRPRVGAVQVPSSTRVSRTPADTSSVFEPSCSYIWTRDWGKQRKARSVLGFLEFWIKVARSRTAYLFESDDIIWLCQPKAIQMAAADWAPPVRAIVPEAS